MDDSNKYAIAIMAALLFIVAGILLFVSGYNMLQLESIGRSSVSEFYYNADGIANIGWGIFCFAMATILIPIANHSFETSLNLAEQKTILLEKMNQLEKLCAQPTTITEEIDLETLPLYKTFDFTNEYIEEWPLDVNKIQLFVFQDTIIGKLTYQNKSDKEIQYVEWELKGFDILNRPINPDNPLVVKMHAKIGPNEFTSSNFIELPKLIFDVEVSLLAVVYADGQIEYMPEVVTRGTIPPLKKLEEVELGEFKSFVISFLKDKGIQQTPEYFHDSTEICWNCAFCGEINSQKDPTCRNCNVERKIQLYVREKFLLKKFNDFKYNIY